MRRPRQRGFNVGRLKHAAPRVSGEAAVRPTTISSIT